MSKHLPNPATHPRGPFWCFSSQGALLSKPPSARIPLRALLGSFLKVKDVTGPRGMGSTKNLNLLGKIPIPRSHRLGQWLCWWQLSKWMRTGQLQARLLGKELASGEGRNRQLLHERELTSAPSSRKPASSGLSRANQQPGGKKNLGGEKSRTQV